MSYDKPTVDEIKKLREDTGMGYTEARRTLLKARMMAAIQQECTLEDLRLIVESVLAFL